MIQTVNLTTQKPSPIARTNPIIVSPTWLSIFFDHRVLLSRSFHAVTLTIVIDSEPRSPVALNPRAAMPQAELSIVDRPASSIGVP